MKSLNFFLQFIDFFCIFRKNIAEEMPTFLAKAFKEFKTIGCTPLLRSKEKCKN
jgi:hypothetical protein